MILATGGPIPNLPYFRFDPDKIDIERTEDGTLILEGRVGFSLAGVFGPFDTEYFVTVDGITYHNEFFFRGIGVGTLIRLVKDEDRIVIEYPEKEK